MIDLIYVEGEIKFSKHQIILISSLSSIFKILHKNKELLNHLMVEIEEIKNDILTLYPFITIIYI